MFNNKRNTRTKEYYAKKRQLRRLVIDANIRESILINDQKQITNESTKQNT